MSPPSGRLHLVSLVAAIATAAVPGANSATPCSAGTVALFNSSASAVSNSLTMNRVPAGTTFRAALYYLPDTGVVPTEADFDHGTVLLPSVGFAFPGVFNGGTRSTPATTPGGGDAWFHVRVWESAFGTNVFPSYEEARDAQALVYGRRPLVGGGSIVKVTTGNPCAIPPTVPAFLALQGFCVGTDLVLDHVAPTLTTCPTDIEVTLPPNQVSGVARFTAMATDDVDPAPVVTCNPASGSVFPVGLTTVTCTALDFCGNRSQCSFTVSVSVLGDHTPPTITCPTNITVAVVTGQVSRVVNFTVTALDDADPAPVVTCNPASGATFPAGATLVNCVARDWSANSTVCSFTVTVDVAPDTTPPTLICPTHITVGAYAVQVPKVVPFAATTTDDIDPRPVVTCQPPSGSGFPLGETSVTCTARDFSSNSSQCTFTVTVNLLEDRVPPILICPSNIVLGVYAWQTARILSFLAAATDDVDPAPVVTCQPPSGSSFPLGETSVRCTARDFGGNAGQCGFLVRVEVVEDHTPPTLTCSDVRVSACASSAVVNFAPTATDDVDLSPVVTCQPPSGSVVPLGETIVTCTARDLGSNASTCSFTVAVSLGGGGGTFQFSNGSRDLITNGLTGAPIPVGSNFLAAVYYLPDRAVVPSDVDFDHGTLLLPAVRFGPVPGRLSSGTRSTPCSTPPGGAAWFQLRVWESVFGSNIFMSYEAARDTRTPVGGRFPLLTVLSPARVVTGDPTGVPPGTPGTVGVTGSYVTTRTLCVPPPLGLVAWWTGDGNADDLAGGRAGSLNGAALGAGKMGQAFRLDAPRTGVALPDTANLRLQTFTIEAWVRRASTSQVTLDVSSNAALFSCAQGGYELALADDGRLCFTKVGDSAVFSHLMITDTQFHHVAVTKAGSEVVIYLDGTPEAVGPYDPGFVFDGPAAIGARGGDLSDTFWGSIDEVTVYNRALADTEIQTLAGATTGKCVVGIPPAVAAEPQSRTVCPGDSAVFTVAAAGSPPLGYQWWFEGEALAGARGASLQLESVAANMAGRYVVVVTNAMGAITSGVANLSLDARPPLVTLNGNANVTWECPEKFFDPGAVAQAACNGSLPVAIHGAVDVHRAGTYTLTYSATDSEGHTGTATRTVIVADTSPPELVCPPHLVAEFTSATGAVVTFVAPMATDRCAGSILVQCLPRSGSQCPIGTTPVICTATDASGNFTSCSFAVTVLGAQGTVYRLIELLETLNDTTTTPQDAERLSQAIEHLIEALAPPNWVDETHVKTKDGHAVFDGLKQAVGTLALLTRDKRSQLPGAGLRLLMERMAQVAGLLAVIELQEASAIGSDPKQLAQDWEEVDRGDAEAARGTYDEAIKRYRNAWQHSAHLGAKLTVRVTAGSLRLELLAFPGETCAIEASTNLVDWVTIGIRTAGPEGIVLLEDIFAGQFKSRFYRAKSVP